MIHFFNGSGAPASALSDAHSLYSLLNNRSLAKAITRIIQTKTTKTNTTEPDDSHPSPAHRRDLEDTQPPHAS
jgi:hypothetical protein